MQDDRMLRGHGRYVDDIDDVGTLHAAIVRSPVSSGEVIAVDTSRALALPGVSLVLGPDEVTAALGTIPHPWLIPGQQVADVKLADTQIRYVGQPLAVVVATSRAMAEDAAELVEIDFKERDAVVGVAAAAAPDAPLVYPELGSNRVGSMHYGDPAESLHDVFARAATVVDREFVIPRVGHNSLETRGLVADYVPGTGRLEVISSTQVPHLVRQELGRVLGLRVDRVHVVAPDVGGAFGQKTSLFPDETFVCLAAKTLGRRVKWIEDRSESLIAAYQGRGQRTRGRLALDVDGRFLALHLDIHGDLGAFPSTGTGGAGPFQVSGLMVEGPYRFELAAATVTAWYTNSVPTGAYRGYGMQESCYVRERLVDEAARVLGADPVELRERNMLGPDELPFVSRTQMPYDSGNYPEALTRAAAIGAERTTTVPISSRIRRGVGLASMTEITGFAPSALLEMFNIHWSGYDASRIRVNEDGTVTVFSGVTSIGQGIETALAQIAADRLGVPLDLVEVQLGDTDTAPYSNMGSQASRGLPLGGGALWQAADRMRTRMHELAAAYLKVDVSDVTFDGADFHGPAGATVAWTEIAHRGWMGWGRDLTDPTAPIALDELAEFDPPSITYGYATHGAQVAVDLDTGKVAVEGYWLVHDAGVVVNPLVAEGQMTGGVAMGIGAALLEEVGYSDTGQPITATYLDYLLPLSEDVPDIVQEHLVTPSALNPGGFRGLGESGIIPPPAAIANAVAAAVPEIAERLVELPMSPSAVWTLLEEAGLTR
ncbi:xanthine dehydrogenase family protein molybdopterin-binding subunit [Pseudonocardia petroleophila]|uniref:Xanthine dehydrogenase family protein n=1 Tax=Pseudonocardia petroleophila TaxID=37331 RepID=A0A7G7MKI6_9PSEU|nr:xanthine dehydrogenase family protein molybdopterin-binding subunit [Pseudonocardia petroleophila]QNG53297.1 xanthine dehydrogenase family protein [Pseudonocardia petroleophila]